MALALEWGVVRHGLLTCFRAVVMAETLAYGDTMASPARVCLK
jgi:hypothetical protein